MVKSAVVQKLSRFVMLSILFALGSVFALIARATPEDELAKQFVATSTIQEVMTYLNDAIRSSGAQARSPEELANVDRVLNLAATHFDFAPKHLPALIELAEIRIHAKSQDQVARTTAFKVFVQAAIIKNLRGDGRSVAVAEELNHELSERFETTRTSWSRLSVQERKDHAELFGLIAVATAEPEYTQRLLTFVHTGSAQDVIAFTQGLNKSSGVVITDKTEQSRFSATYRFRKVFNEKLPGVQRLESAAVALTMLSGKDFGSGAGGRFVVPWTPVSVTIWFDQVFKNGSPRFISEALTLLEENLGHADKAPSRGVAFAEVLDSNQFKQSLVQLEISHPQFEKRIHAIQEKMAVIAQSMGRIRLEKISAQRDAARAEANEKLDVIAKANAAAALQMRRALGIHTCRDLFR